MSDPLWEKTLLAFMSAAAALTLKEGYEWWRRPRLKPDFRGKETGFKVYTEETRKSPKAGSDGYANDATETYKAMYVNLRVRNFGKTAKSCRGFLVGIDVWENNWWQPTDYCDSIPLAWSYRSDDDALYGIDLPAGVDQFLNVFSIRQPEIEAGFKPATIPPTLRYAARFRFKEPGEFRFKILITAEDAEVQRFCLYVKWTGDWADVWKNETLEVRELVGGW